MLYCARCFFAEVLSAVRSQARNPKLTMARAQVVQSCCLSHIRHVAVAWGLPWSARTPRLLNPCCSTAQQVCLPICDEIEGSCPCDHRCLPQTFELQGESHSMVVNLCRPPDAGKSLFSEVVVFCFNFFFRRSLVKGATTTMAARPLEKPNG